MNQAWTRYLPAFARSRIEGSEILQRIIHNTGWLFLDRMLRMGVGFFVTVWITRYLGPGRYGMLSYASAFVGLFTAIANLGLGGIVIRDVVRHPEANDEILGTAFFLKACGGLLALLLSLGIIFFLRPGESLTHWLVAITGTGFIFQALEVFDFWFQSRLLSKRTVFANIPGFLIITIAKVAMILMGAPLIAFAWAGALEIFLGSIGVMAAYQVNTKRLANLKVSMVWARNLLRDSWPLVFAGIMLMVYNRIDQVMIGQMLDDRSVGLYSAAVKLSEFWYVFPFLVAQSMFPAVVEAKTAGEEFYYQRLQKVLNVMAMLSYAFVVPLFLLSRHIVVWIYGNSFYESGAILQVYVVAGVFVMIGQVRENWVTVESLTRFSLYASIIGAALNVMLNLVLIPRFGGVGAAYATLASLCVSGYLINSLHSKTRGIFFLQTRAIFLARVFSRKPA